MAKTTSVKKRNAQDATRAYDVKPLRARIAKLEASVKRLSDTLDALADAVRNLNELVTPLK